VIISGAQCTRLTRDDHWTWIGLDPDYSKFVEFGLTGLQISSKFRNPTGIELSEWEKECGIFI